MPPLRTFPTTKPLKTERTHEENQERAYIAASRRSDRSLEARVESARRASEIHKRRTGRSLRVTEQDVINEEMYEEEDDDLPMGYRRLTAHLQTGSADFNRRLAAYLTNHVAMRSALDQAIHPYAYSNPAQMAPAQANMFPSPLNTQGVAYSPQSQTPTSPRTPHPYRQTPYPMPGTPSFRPSQPSLHHRSASTSLPQGMAGTAQSYTTSPVDPPSPNNSRRMSMPAAPTVKSEALPAGAPLETRPRLSREPSAPNQAAQNVSNDIDEAIKPTSMGPPSQPSFEQSLNMSISPLTMNLPQDSQQLLGPALNPSDPFMAMLMAGGSASAPSFYDYMSYGQNAKPVQENRTYQGMNSTLAPSALSMSPNRDGGIVNPDYFEALPSNYADLKGFDFPGSQNSSNGENSNSGQDNSWEALIDDKTWRENPT